MRCARGCCPSDRDHYRSIGVAIRALAAGNRADQRLAKDLKAYKSMVDQGLEPCTTEGAWELQDRPVHEIEGRLPDGLYE